MTLPAATASVISVAGHPAVLAISDLISFSTVVV
jgi:hypothetical protein